MMIPKPTTERSEAYLAFVRSKGCIVSRCECKADAHHVPKVGGGKVGKKTDDTRTVGLCRSHHTIYHDIGRAEFERNYAIVLDYEIALLNREYAKLPKRQTKERKIQPVVKVSVKHCPCKGNHELRVSSVHFGLNYAKYQCPKLGWVKVERRTA